MTLDSLKVVLADDNAHMREIVGVLLLQFGVTQIRAAKDGGHALQLMESWTPDLAIVDLKMEPMDGVEFTQRVRTSPQSPNPYLPVIMMTGHSARLHVVKARDAGVTEFIVKPINARTLLDRITIVLERPRPFVRTATYFGPDRRRRADPAYTGPMRRQTDLAEREVHYI